MYKKFDEKIDKIIEKMTLREKIGQLNQVSIASYGEDIDRLENDIKEGKIGSIILASSATAGNDAQGHVFVEWYDKLQHIAVEQSKNHIPIIYGRDVIHGHRIAYPLPLASASAFNDELIEKCYTNIANEAADDGIHWTFSPMLDFCHDPRWGRIVEGPGEDPLIGKNMARACIKGFQGDDLSQKGRLAACAKHYIGYGASEGGRDYHRTEISDTTLYNYYLPAFRSAIDSGVATVMSSFNDISGIPTSGSKRYLTDILRGQLGFDGFVVSDWGAIEQLESQGYAEDRADCAKLALNAGLDLDMCDKCYIENLESLVKSGDVSEETIDLSVKRILRIKFACGLFDNPYYEHFEYNIEEHIADARKLAAESMVLLKNENVLPLKKNSKIALIGPFEKERRSLLGTWTLDADIDSTQTLFEAVAGILNNNGGTLFTQNDEISIFESSNYSVPDADVVILALGESNWATGENRAVSDISLNSAQIELINKVKAFGKKTVGVFFCGRPIAMEGVADNLDAVLYAWHSGSETANAVCDILFGDVIPSGKTPVTFPRKSGHIPMYYNVTPSGRPVNCYYSDNANRCYIDSIATPYYPFGYGLSYTTFEYSKISCIDTTISLDDLKKGKTITLSINVKNSGKYSGKEIIELYIHDKVASIIRPIKELKAYKKVFIEKSNVKKVEFDLSYDDLGFYNENGEYIVEKGKFDIYIGKDSLTENKIEVSVI